MFTTFSTSTQPTSAAHDGGSGTGSPKTRTPAAPRPRRNQVRRACDSCKVLRIKCDNQRPCSTCVNAHRECCTSGENQFRTIADAVEEVKRLRTKVREYETPADRQSATRENHRQRRQRQTPPQQQQEQQQKHGQQQEQQQQAQQQTRSERQRSHHPPEVEPASSECPALGPGPSPSSAAARNGVLVDSVFYGITSWPFFIRRLSHFIQTRRQGLRLDPDLELRTHRPPWPTVQSEDAFLTRGQESRFLDLFWQTYYFSYPILHEGNLRRDFKDLWDHGGQGTQRKPSPLVDIILALCTQLGASLVRQQTMASPNSSTDNPNVSRDSPRRTSDAQCPSLAGFQYYRRCEEALDVAIENPSIETVQCYIFSIVYLYQAGLLNRAQVVAGKAIMMAMMLGLQTEPPAGQPEPAREMARRTWWSLYILDAHLAIEAARPPMVSSFPSTCHQPSDSDEIANWLSPHYSYDSDCATWVGYQTQMLRLLQVVTGIGSALRAGYDTAVGEDGVYDDFISDAEAREKCARELVEEMKKLDSWVKDVPASYRVPRRDDGQPFSTDRSQIDFGSNTLIHCQRQRLLLELSYHQYCISLYQPFICHSRDPDIPTPVSDSMASAALNHALTFTSMIRQTLTSCEALNGDYKIFRWQKNAIFTMLGYSYTFPLCASAASIRGNTEAAIAVIDMYRHIHPESGSVATVARTLAEDVNTIVTGLDSSNTNWTSSSSSALTTPRTILSAEGQGSTRRPTTGIPVPIGTWSDSRHPDKALGPPLNVDARLDLGFLDDVMAESMVGVHGDSMDMLWEGLGQDRELIQFDNWNSTI
ncbi:fungal-specific transcription factor domain-containing protein [Astrocystis sublimbata]|nr:fungal-specific transcription factor domain-containing protein [Astrocystis sublimbata]